MAFYYVSNIIKELVFSLLCLLNIFIYFPEGLGVKGGEKTSCSNKHYTRDSANAKEPLVALDILRAIDNDLAASHPVLLASIDTVYPDPVLQTARRGTRTCAGVSW